VAPLSLPDPPLTDGTIALREKTEADIPALVAAVQDPLIPRYTRVPSPYGEREAGEFIVEQRRRRDAGTELSLLVVDAGRDEDVQPHVQIPTARPPERRHPLPPKALDLVRLGPGGDLEVEVSADRRHADRRTKSGVGHR